MKEYADYKLCCIDHAHFHYGAHLLSATLFIPHQRALKGLISYSQDTKNSIEPLFIAAEKAVWLRQRFVMQVGRYLVWAKQGPT
ncbi:hypothetical protein QMA77_20115 [Pantoea ananatis]|uniref:hypothetical protein n=1 Tax=Pantoea ananas TaxID=553 RepID=UPI001B30758C|nr:hypothetical protein [Pantoea ananatis]MDI6539232.1 hypothetical protein [Pantoea ananatis]UYL03029.1 hypothetical protein NG830_06755 [Pantoea ananatis]